MTSGLITFEVVIQRNSFLSMKPSLLISKILRKSILISLNQIYQLCPEIFLEGIEFQKKIKHKRYREGGRDLKARQMTFCQ